MPASQIARTSIRAGTPRRGAASLVVVMVLFFVLTLVAAYTSRNLIFEQRTSANQYRSTLAFETADAGIEWALARLNEGRMDDTCTQLPNAAAVTAAPQPSFRERYLGIDPATGVVTRLPQPTTTLDKLAGCIFNGTGWTCHCPDTGNPAPTVTYSGNGPFAAFWVRFQPVVTVPARPGVVRIQVNACTRSATECLNFIDREAASGDGLATVWDMVALRSAMVSAPAAALTVRGTFTGPGGGDHPVVTNTDVTSGGLTIHGGAAIAIAPTLTLNTIPGSPPQQSFAQNDAALALPNLVITPATPASVGENRMFNSVFGMWLTTYLAQPALAFVNCAAGCNATDVNNAVLLRPGAPVYVSGAGPLNIDAAIGTAAAPVLILADNDVEFGGVHTFYGMIYSRDDDNNNWRLRGNGTIRGAAISERGFRLDDDPSIIYDRDVLLRVRYLNGSFAKVPGGWRDMSP